MKLTVFRNERAAAAALAVRIAERLREQPRLVLGLPTGRTPVALYRELVALHVRSQVDFSQATTFNLDEFWRLPTEHPGSYHLYMQRHLFGPIQFDSRRANFLDGMARDADEECERYESAIEQAGGIDVQILGIGANGHIGFNEPASALQARTHKATLKSQTRRANAMFFDHDASKVPAEALSMGMSTILHSRSIILLAMGQAKGRIVERMIHGPLTTRLPASFLQVHTNVEIVLDEAAARQRPASSQS